MSAYADPGDERRPAPHAEPFPEPSPDQPPYGDRWSTWDGASHGPHPRPDWVITDAGAVDEDLGVLKTGKEADVHVVRRSLPGTGRHTDLAAKRFRDGQHRLFHRDAGYLEGRRVRKSRETRAMARRTDFGRALISGQWATAEFAALSRLWSQGLPVPYPVQFDGEELLMEFVGRDGVAAPRLAATNPEPDLLAHLWEQVSNAVVDLAAAGWAHGDLSAYNILLHDDRAVLIDWPQIVDVVGNPQGLDFLQRDCTNLTRWFRSAGLAVDADHLFGMAASAAAARW